LEHPNTVSVSLGSIYNQDITLDTYEPFQTFQYSFKVMSTISTNLIFDHWGADRVGLLLDNVMITSDPIPEPSTIFLLCLGLIGLAGFKKKFKA
jgi:hypothetical protein